MTPTSLQGESTPDCASKVRESVPIGTNTGAEAGADQITMYEWYVSVYPRLCLATRLPSTYYRHVASYLDYPSLLSHLPVSRCASDVSEIKVGTRECICSPEWRRRPWRARL